MYTVSIIISFTKQVYTLTRASNRSSRSDTTGRRWGWRGCWLTEVTSVAYAEGRFQETRLGCHRRFDTATTLPGPSMLKNPVPCAEQCTVHQRSEERNNCAHLTLFSTSLSIKLVLKIAFKLPVMNNILQ